MKHLILLLTMALASTACADFNPDLSDLEGSGTNGETSGDSPTSGPDMDPDTGEDTGMIPDMGTETGYCGDGVKNNDEECDGTDFGDETCTSQNEAYMSGELTCLQDCIITALYCDISLCEEQPESGDYSPCQIDNGNAETCGDADLYCLALWAPNEEGFCGRTCQQHSDCTNELYEGCGSHAGGTCAIPNGQAQGRCVIECDIDQDCPMGMACWETDAFGPSMKICK